MDKEITVFAVSVSADVTETSVTCICWYQIISLVQILFSLFLGLITNMSDNVSLSCNEFETKEYKI